MSILVLGNMVFFYMQEILFVYAMLVLATFHSPIKHRLIFIFSILYQHIWKINDYNNKLHIPFVVQYNQQNRFGQQSPLSY